MTTPYFSICIPAYNCPTLVLEALTSVACQSFTDWEVVLADDGSTDNTLDVCMNQKVVATDKIKVLATEHSGLLDTRRQLHERAEGKVIVGLDADDAFCNPDALAIIHSTFETTQCDFVMFNATRSLASMRPHLNYEELKSNESPLLDIDAVRSLFSKSYCINNINFKAYRNGLVKIPKLVEPLQMTEDRLQVAQLLQVADSCALIDEPLYFYRPNPKSLTAKPYSTSCFYDKLRSEDFVDVMRAEHGIPLAEGDTIVITYLAHDLKNVRESIGNKRERFVNYSRLYDMWRNSSRFGASASNEIRADLRTTYSLFCEKKYSLLDLHLSVCVAIKRMMKKSGQ